MDREALWGIIYMGHLLARATGHARHVRMWHGAAWGVGRGAWDVGRGAWDIAGGTCRVPWGVGHGACPNVTCAMCACGTMGHVRGCIHGAMWNIMGRRGACAARGM
jgi:hypothetical protein